MNREIMEKLAGQGLTPAYVFDLDVLRKRVESIRTTLAGRAGLCFAMKANSFLVRPLSGLVDCYEVCSPGEFRICERLEIPMERIVLSGVNKEEKEISRVVETYRGRGTYTIESRAHLHILQNCAAKAGCRLKVLLRLSSGNQFGVDPGEAEEIIRTRGDYPNLDFAGIQQYTGTQKKKFNKIAAELEALDALLIRWREDYGYEAGELEYGPGLFVPYFTDDGGEDDTLVRLTKALDKMAFPGRIILEMGRYLAAEAGYFFTKVVDMKENFGEKYALVDGGIHHVNYYGQFMAMKQPHVTHIPAKQEESGKAGEERDTLSCEDICPPSPRACTAKCPDVYHICGSLCTSGDLLVKKMPLINLQIHDILVFENLGAYSVTEAMYLFLSRDMPRVYFYSEESGLTLIRDTIATHLWNGEQS